MEGLEKINKWLHVWTEAERAARVKKPCATALETQGESPASRTEERVEVMRPACMSCAEPSPRKKGLV